MKYSHRKLNVLANNVQKQNIKNGCGMQEHEFNLGMDLL